MSKHRILLVDDDPDVRAIIGSALRPSFEVVEAVDGQDALNRLEAYEPDFAIVDSAMPTMDGYNLCEAIRKHDRFRGIPVIFLSAHGKQDDIKKGYACGANLYLTKPVDPGRIIKNIEFTISHEQVQSKPKRYSIIQLKEMDAELSKPKPAGQTVISMGWSGSRERQQSKQWNFTEETPKPERPVEPPPEPATEPLRQPEPAGAEPRRASMRPAARPAEPKPEPAHVAAPNQEFRSEFRKPQPQEQGIPLQQAPPAREAAPGAMPRVMIVENEEDARELMQVALRQSFEVTTARDGLEAVQNIVAYQPDILLIDIMMPRMNGYQLLQSLRRNPAYKNLPVIVVSAKSTPRDREYVFRLGATDFLAKPFDAIELFQCVHRVTDAEDFRVQAKRIPIVEIVEKEYLESRNKTDEGSLRDQRQKMTGLKEALRREQRQK